MNYRLNKLPPSPRSEDAFAELVQRYLDLVYSAALRQVNGDAPLAQDVAQTVFSDLARKAASLLPRKDLAGWLYTSAHFAATKAVRTENRRRDHEQEAQLMHELFHLPASEPDWEKLCPVLDQAMHELKEADREAILLRYFQNQRLADIGARLGLTENAGRMRVERALEKLRDRLSHRGVTASASVLSIAISANAVQAAPVGLAVTVSAAATLTGTTLVATTATAIATKAIVMTTLQKTILAVTLAAGIGTGIFEARQISRLRGEVQRIQQQQATLVEENERLLRERDQTANRLVALADDIASRKANTPEMLRLRGELARLGKELRESPITRIASLKQKLEQMPEATFHRGPLQFLSDFGYAG